MVLSLAYEAKEVIEAPDRDIQERNSSRQEECELTIPPEATRTESSSTAPRHFAERMQGTWSLLDRTTKPVLRHKTQPTRERKQLKILGETIFPSAMSTEVQSVNFVTNKRNSEEQRKELPVAASGPSILRTPN